MKSNGSSFSLISFDEGKIILSKISDDKFLILKEFNVIQNKTTQEI